jgi:hypothetical protein
MTTPRGSARRTLVALVVICCAGAAASAQPRTDVVTLANGDRVTGEVVRLDRGRLEFKTDDAGTIELEWNKLTQLEATRHFDVSTRAGDRFLGSLGAAPPRSIAVVGAAGSTVLPMAEVIEIIPIGASFWKKLDGSIDAGFSYTQSSRIAQLNANSVTVFHRPAFEARLSASTTVTQSEDGAGRDDRGALEASYRRYPWQRWFAGAMGRFETNESLGLRLRSQVGAMVGPRFVRSHQAELTLGAGLVANDERGVEAEPTQNLEALLLFDGAFFTYDRPRTNVDVRLQYYPSLTNFGRQRLQLDAAVKREFWKDLFLALNLYDSFDSRPPNPEASANDVGVTVSVGWSY